MKIAIGFKNGRPVPLGAFAHNAKGWRFIPWCQNSPSRKDWPSPEAALPRWARNDCRIVDAANVNEAIDIVKSAYYCVEG